MSETSVHPLERLLGAANGDEPKRRIHGSKKRSREGEDRAAHGNEGVFVARFQKWKNNESESEDPRVKPTRGTRKFVFPTYVWATRHRKHSRLPRA